MSSVFRILSIDGGGVRGVIPLEIILKIEEILNGQPIHKHFDMIAGTSTGAIIACGLTLPKSNSSLERKYSPLDLLKDYTNESKVIFPFTSNLITRNISKFLSIAFKEHTDLGIEKVLLDKFGNSYLSILLSPVVIPSYDITKNKIELFTSREALVPNKDNLIREVLRSTSAAPTYFSSSHLYRDKESSNMIDGGVVMNNPILGALTEYLRHKSFSIYKKNDQLPRKIKILSIGTGHFSSYLSISKLKIGGKAVLASSLVELMMREASKIALDSSKDLLNFINPESEILRLDVALKNNKFRSMNNASNNMLNYLKSQTKEQILDKPTILEALKTHLE